MNIDEALSAIYKFHEAAGRMAGAHDIADKLMNRALTSLRYGDDEDAIQERRYSEIVKTMADGYMRQDYMKTIDDYNEAHDLLRKLLDQENSTVEED